MRRHGCANGHLSAFHKICSVMERGTALMETMRSSVLKLVLKVDSKFDTFISQPRY